MGKNSKRRRAEERAAAKANKAAPEAGSSTEAQGGESWFHAKSPALRFVVITGVLMTLFYACFYTPPDQNPKLDSFVKVYLTAYAWGAALLLGIFGIEAKSDGTLVFVDFLPVEVVRGCDAMEPIALYVAAVIAVQMSWRSKMVGLFGGLAILGVINTIRIAILSYISAKHPESFEFAHLTVAQTGFILVTVTLWLLWAMWASGRETPKSNEPATG